MLIEVVAAGTEMTAKEAQSKTPRVSSLEHSELGL
jgi:hypothetical protein